MKVLNKIDVRSVYNEEREGFGPLRVPKTYPKRLPSVETNKNNEILFIDKIKRAARLGVRSNAGCAFERRLCIRTHSHMRSTFWCVFDRKSIIALCVFERRRLSSHVLRSTADSRSRRKVEAMEDRVG
jgi:hypothetical protein